MPAEDLLRFVGEPLVFSRWWLMVGVTLILGVIAWCVGVFVWTLPPGRLRAAPVIGEAHTRLMRRRFTRSVRDVGRRFRSGAITAEQACAELGQIVRHFLSVATGARAEYLHVSEIAAAPAPVAGAAPLLAALTAAQFDRNAHPDVEALEHAAGELISTWD